VTETSAPPAVFLKSESLSAARLPGVPQIRYRGRAGGMPGEIGQSFGPLPGFCILLCHELTTGVQQNDAKSQHNRGCFRLLSMSSPDDGCPPYQTAELPQTQNPFL
jgi:hypothetical protein